jgi:hypothetical protein
MNTKKFFLYLMLFLVPALVLAGCGLSRPTLKDRLGSVIELRDGSYEGVIEPLPSLDVYQMGTHMLITEDDKTVIIQSPSIDLNKYTDKAVRVTGEVTNGIGDALDVLTVTGVEYLDETASGELSDYSNKLFGFSFTYPEAWKLSESSGSVTLSLGEKDIVTIRIYNDEADMDTFVSSQEEGDGVEVTIGAQRSDRFVSDGNMRFYVSNPPKKKVYLIKYVPTVNKVDDEKGAEEELNLFYDFLESFGLIYVTQLTGDKCGGLQQLECPEDYRCELESAGKYAEGVCVPVESDATSASCPFIAPPDNCYDYRISEYSKNGCPARFECVGSGSGSQQPTFRDLNVVDAGKKPDDIPLDNTDQTDEESEMADAEETDESESDYEIPEAADVTREYVNSQKSFTLLYPKNWYYASFGPTDGSLWTVGFADFSLEEPEEALITLKLTEEDGGRTSKKIGDVYYTLSGPVDLAGVMEAIANSIEAF